MGRKRPTSPHAPRFQKRFRHCPVVLPCIGPGPVQAVASEAVAAVRAGADGVFIEADGLGGESLRRLTREIRTARPRAWVGLACRWPSHELIESVPDEIQGVWFRGAGSIPEPELSEAVDALREWQDWEGLLFGGLDLGARDLRDHAAAAVSLSRLVDVVLLEVPAIDNLFEVGRVKAIKHGLGTYPLGVAADVFVDCVDPLACVVECIVPSWKAPTGMGALIESVRACHHS